MKKSPDIKQQIVDRVKSVAGTKESLCQHFGITERTLQLWRKEDSDFDLAIKMAESERDNVDRDSWHRMLQSLEGPALKALEKLVNGHTWKRETVDYKTFRWKGKDGVFHEEEKMVNRRVQPVKVEPNLQAIIFVLTNIDPEYFQK